MLISKKKLCDTFYNYTKLIYQEVGRKLSAKQEIILKNKIEAMASKWTLKNKIKELCKKAK